MSCSLQTILELVESTTSLGLNHGDGVDGGERSGLNGPISTAVFKRGTGDEIFGEGRVETGGISCIISQLNMSRKA